MKITTATFKLDKTDREDMAKLAEIGRDKPFQYGVDWFEATSVRQSRNGVFVTAKAVNS